MTSIDVNDMSGITLTIEVNVTRRFRMRVAIGLWLMRLACRVMRCGVEIKDCEA